MRDDAYKPKVTEDNCRPATFDVCSPLARDVAMPRWNLSPTAIGLVLIPCLAVLMAVVYAISSSQRS